MADTRPVLEDYARLLMDEARDARTTARFDELCQRVERVLQVAQQMAEVPRDMARPRLICPVGCEVVFDDLAAQARHMADAHPVSTWPAAGEVTG